MCWECYSDPCRCYYYESPDYYTDDESYLQYDPGREDDESYQQYEQECKDAEDESIGIDNLDIAVEGGRESANLRAMKLVLPILRLVHRLPASNEARAAPARAQAA